MYPKEKYDHEDYLIHLKLKQKNKYPSIFIGLTEEIFARIICYTKPESRAQVETMT